MTFVRVAVFGAGEAARATLSRARSLLGSPPWHVVGVCDPHLPRAQRLCADLGSFPCLPGSYRTPRALWKEVEADAALFFGPPHPRREALALAAERGCALWIAPPLAPSAEASREVVKTLASARVECCIAWPHRFSPAFAQAGKYLPRSAAEAIFLRVWGDPAQLPVSLASGLDAAWHWTREIAQAQAFRSEKGALAATLASRSGMALQLLALPRVGQEMKWQLRIEGAGRWTELDAASWRGGSGSESASTCGGELSDGLDEMLRAWLEAVALGRTAALRARAATLGDALRSARVADAVERAAKGAGRVRLLEK
jgi:predicted dehydrogenase